MSEGIDTEPCKTKSASPESAESGLLSSHQSKGTDSSAQSAQCTLVKTVSVESTAGHKESDLSGQTDLVLHAKKRKKEAASESLLVQEPSSSSYSVQGESLLVQEPSSSGSYVQATSLTVKREPVCIIIESDSDEETTELSYPPSLRPAEISDSSDTIKPNTASGVPVRRLFASGAVGSKSQTRIRAVPKSESEITLTTTATKYLGEDVLNIPSSKKHDLGSQTRSRVIPPNLDSESSRVIPPNLDSESSRVIPPNLDSESSRVIPPNLDSESSDSTTIRLDEAETQLDIAADIPTTIKEVTTQLPGFSHTPLPGTCWWLYRQHGKGPKGTPFSFRLPSVIDPHLPVEFHDPVFRQQEQLISPAPPPGYVGKPRTGDGNDITPSPSLLLVIGDVITNISEQMALLTELSQKKEKIKLSSQLARTRRRASHEANKIIFGGLSKERDALSRIITRLRAEIPAWAESGESLADYYRMLINSLPPQVAGARHQFVGQMLAEVAETRSDISSEEIVEEREQTGSSSETHG